VLNYKHNWLGHVTVCVVVMEFEVKMLKSDFLPYSKHFDLPLQITCLQM